jgi:hypothetical protein
MMQLAMMTLRIRWRLQLTASLSTSIALVIPLHLDTLIGVLTMQPLPQWLVLLKFPSLTLSLYTLFNVCYQTNLLMFVLCFFIMSVISNQLQLNALSSLTLNCMRIPSFVHLLSGLMLRDRCTGFIHFFVAATCYNLLVLMRTVNG